MNSIHAPNRCAPRVARIAQVKFVALPLDEEPPPPPGEPAAGDFEELTLLDAFRNFMIRVIRRPEAARP